MDTSAILGFQQPNAMQNLSGLLGVANGVQTLQQNQQKTQQGGIDLNERQNLQRFMSDPKNYTDQDGNVDFNRAIQGVMKVAPTTGLPVAQNLFTAQKQHTDAVSALNTLGDQDRTRIGSVLAAIPANAPPDVVKATADTLAKEYRGRLDPMVSLFKQGYDQAAKGGPEAVATYMQKAVRGVLPQETQVSLDTPSVLPVSNNQQSYGVNVKPGVNGMPVGSVVPGTSVQLQPPPTQPIVGPNNQPGILGPQGSPPPAGKVPNGYAGGSAAAAAPEQLRIMQEERVAAQAKGDAATVAALDREMARIRNQPGFVATGPVPGANESKLGSVSVVNDHWAKINAGSADSPVATSLLSTIRDLAPAAITGTEAGKRAYWNGLFNALHIGTQATGDMQKDTDLLQKAMAQLNIATPATTDAMRTLIEAGRPHSTMSAGAIQDAAGQIEGQIKANMAMRNLMTSDKRYADATGDVTSYDNKRQALEKLMDPRIFQYESLAPADRKAFINKINQKDRSALIEKTKKLEAMGVFQ
jgi:hypothetical protein